MREKGDIFEEQVAYDMGIRKTNNSGAKFDNADLSNRDLIIECKYKGKKSFQSCSNEISKLTEQAKKHNKEWIYIQQTETNAYVVLDYNYFLELWTTLNHGSES